MKLNPALVQILSPAYPCPEFKGACAGEMRWQPQDGHVPRGFAGATGSTGEVELVLLVAEPGDPRYGEAHESIGTAYDYAMSSFRTGRDPFHKNVRKILELCWTDLSFEDQMRRTWLTESVLCSAQKSTGPVSERASLACGQRYLLSQLALFPNALLVALGGKARDRLHTLGVHDFVSAFAVGRPGCYQAGALPSWERIAIELASRRRTLGA